MPIPAAVPIALSVGSLISGFLGGKKKAKEQKTVNDANRASTQQYRTDTALRQDAIDKGNVDVLNQNAQADARKKQTRNGLAQALLASLMPETIDKESAGNALNASSGFNPIKYTAPPPNVVQPMDMEVDPSTGGTWDAFSKVFGTAAGSLTESRVADEVAKKRKEFEDQLKTQLWTKDMVNNPSKLPWDYING